MTYSEKLKHPKWQKKRLQILSRDKFTCKKCGDTETQLHVHHKEYISGNDPWDYDNKLLITLCEDCHSIIEKLKTDEPDVDFDQIFIYKSNRWDDGSKILFTSYMDICSMEIYDENKKWVIGFDFLDYEIKNIIKILRKAQNG